MSDRSRRGPHRSPTSLTSLPLEILRKILNLRGVLLLHNDGNGRFRYIHPHLLHGSRRLTSDLSDNDIKKYLSSRNSFMNRATYDNIDVQRDEKGFRVFARERLINPVGNMQIAHFGPLHRRYLWPKVSGPPNRILRSGAREPHLARRSNPIQKRKVRGGELKSRTTA